MSLHTPGPWRTGTPQRGRFCVYAPNANGRGICAMQNIQTLDEYTVSRFGDHPLNLEADANAALIAAAPELLRLVERAMDPVQYLSDDGGESHQQELVDWVSEARAVIAKAKGLA